MRKDSMGNRILFIFLTICGIRDAKKKSFPVWLLCAGCLAPVVLLLAEGGWTDGRNWCFLAAGAVPGLVLLLVCRLAPDSVGSGDAFLMADTGMFLGWEKNLLLWWLASVLSLLLSGGLLLLGKGNRKTKLPMAPFVWLSFCLLSCGHVP